MFDDVCDVVIWLVLDLLFDICCELEVLSDGDLDEIFLFDIGFKLWFLFDLGGF